MSSQREGTHPALACGDSRMPKHLNTYTNLEPASIACLESWMHEHKPDDFMSVWDSFKTGKAPKKWFLCSRLVGISSLLSAGKEPSASFLLKPYYYRK